MTRRWSTARVALEDDPEVNRLVDVGVLILAGLLSFVVFARVPVHALTPGFQGEFKNHALLLTALESDGSTPYSLWYVLQQVLVGSDRDEVVLLNAGWLMLGALAVLKGIVLTGSLLVTSVSRLEALVLGFLLGCAVAFPMPWFDRHSRIWAGPVHYLGTLPPNVFMSATQLVANITAVVAVLTLTLWFQRPTIARFVSMTLAGLVATMGKPGIAPGLLVALVVLSALTVHFGRQTIRSAVARLAVAGVLISVPLLGAYSTFMTGRGRLALHSEIRPFDTWTTFTNQWFPDLIASWAFPIVVVAVLLASRNVTEERRDWLIPAWVVAAVTTVMFAVLAEVDRDGNSFYAGNFAWGAMAATSGLYVMSVIALREITWKVRWIPLSVLLVQAMAGLHYVMVYVDSGSFI